MRSYRHDWQSVVGAQRRSGSRWRHTDSPTSCSTGGDWRIVRLEGFAAASFWGLGTRWCTTTSKEIYDQYVRCSPLLVLLTPRGRFQLQVGGQFKDAADNDAAMSVLRGAPQEILTIVAAALEVGGIRAPS